MILAERIGKIFEGCFYVGLKWNSHHPLFPALLAAFQVDGLRFMLTTDEVYLFGVDYLVARLPEF